MFYYGIAAYLMTIGLSSLIENNVATKLAVDLISRGYKCKEAHLPNFNITTNNFINDFGRILPIYNLVHAYLKQRKYKKNQSEIIHSQIRENLCSPLSEYEQHKHSVVPSSGMVVDINCEMSPLEPIISKEPMTIKPIQPEEWIPNAEAFSRIEFIDNGINVLIHIIDNKRSQQSLVIIDPQDIETCRDQIRISPKLFNHEFCCETVDSIYDWLISKKYKCDKIYRIDN